MVLAVLCTPSQAVDQLYRLGALLREHAAAGVLTQRLEQRTVMGPLRADHPIVYATPLAVATASGALDQVRALLDAGADPRAQTRIEGRTERGDSVLELAPELARSRDYFTRVTGRGWVNEFAIHDAWCHPPSTGGNN
jgi:hypothetical protein